jgi:hypothetical protein
MLWISNCHYGNQFFESPPTVGFQKTDFSVSSTEGVRNTKISFRLRITGFVTALICRFVRKSLIKPD